MPEDECATAKPARPDWDEYFLNIAKAVSTKSKDPKCAVGAVIASSDNVVLSTGFNGFARGVEDDENVLANADEKIKLICHAEQNAIVNAARIGVSLQGASMFVTKFPCLACCNAIIQAGITLIRTDDNKYWDDDPLDGDHSRKKSILRQTYLKVDAPNHPDYTPDLKTIRMSLGQLALSEKTIKS
jgi:dCMP deaminase